mmetsp:Transcript_35225/g.40059  ORF Transcript_35225/g.40059 Transcript_35225/m.40059 type:complete len:103 (-) Transcript_35225:81-389(-)
MRYLAAYEHHGAVPVVALQKRKKKSVDDNDTTNNDDGYDPHTDPDDCTAAHFAGNGLNTDANAIWTRHFTCCGGVTVMTNHQHRSCSLGAARSSRRSAPTTD